MELHYYRGQRCNHSKEVVPVFALGHYIDKDDKKDEFSKTLMYFYKYGNDMNFFVDKFIEFFDVRIKGDMKIDFISLMPTNEKDILNPHMLSFVNEVSKRIGIPYKQLLKRTKLVKEQHDLKTVDERMANVKDSIEVIYDVKGLNVIIFDNTSITGSTCSVAYDALKEAGVDKIYFFCFGLGKLGKKDDFDFNITNPIKASEIVERFHWPKVSLIDRLFYKLKKQKNNIKNLL